MDQNNQMPRKPRYTVSNATGLVAGPNSQTHATPVKTDGMHDTGAETSSAQRRARAPPPPRSGNGARQSRVNAVPFRPPRNETQMASSSDIGDARAPATNRKHPPDSHEGVDDHSEDEDYDPEADEIESFDDHLDNMFAAYELTVKEALALPPGKKIVLHHNRELQQVGQAAGLLSGFLETLGSDFQQLPICAKSWKTMSKASKEHAYDQVKSGKLEKDSACWRVFHYEDDKRGWIKRGILQRIRSYWRNSRNHLFHKVYDEELTFEENIKRKPVGIEANHWKKFLQYWLDDDTKEKCRKNAVNRSKQQYTHTGGSKTMARKRHEKISVNPDLTCLQEAIELIESQDPSSKEFSQNDSLAQVLGKERPRRSDYGVQIEEYQMEIVKLKAEAAEVKAEAA
ncbi:hypothetical protein Ahy_B02g057590 [Arachis hypogaea]|uniref:Uncharacterized protein n=1 Tax=Arachis hypogaea TaxID=3818 RepID=A0A445ACB9_ARAHY|nr:hypothetical protein Ahy_B02g057590 [Arachis hypogaea]